MPLDTYGLGVRVDTDINGADKKLGGLNGQALSLVKNFAGNYNRDRLVLCRYDGCIKENLKLLMMH